MFSVVTSLRDASNGLKTNRPPAVRGEPQLEHETTIKIPKTMTAAPFLRVKLLITVIYFHIAEKYVTPSAFI